MSNKKLVLKLVNSIISLCLAMVLTIVISIAWFNQNSKTTAHTVVSVVGSSDLSVTLEGFDVKTDTWKDVSKITFDNFEPGDKYYLRLKIISSSDTTKTLKANYGKCDSKLNDLVSVDLESSTSNEIKGHMTYQGIPIMDVVDNTENTNTYPYAVFMNGNKIYNITKNLNVDIVEEYKIYNAMVSYNLGSSLDDLKPSEISLEGKVANELTEGIFEDGVSVYGNTTSYCYFALEYVDYDSNSSEEKKYESNNYFVYQTFTISKVDVYCS